MRVMTISGLIVQVDVLEKGDLEEAEAAVSSMNVASGKLEGQPQIMNAGSLQTNQVKVELTPDTQTRVSENLQTIFMDMNMLKDGSWDGNAKACEDSLAIIQDLAEDLDVVLPEYKADA